MKTSRSHGFTLIELLVVIAIIAILAAILFPVFALARERARQITCTSNMKQVSLALLQYQEDYDETCPIGFNGNYMYGPQSAPIYNHTVQPFGQPTGIAGQLQPYVKNWNVMTCDDDHPMSLKDAQNYGKVPIGMTNALQVGHTWSWIYGTSYVFTTEAESNPYPVTTVTGFATSTACTGVGAGNSGGWGIPAPAKECDVVADGEPVTQQSLFGWTADGRDTPSRGIAILTLAQLTRPSETRVLKEAVTNLTDQSSTSGSKPVNPFHPNGTTVAYADGHVKFVTTLKQFQSGCDGADWAWDSAGSCNTLGLQRSQHG